MPAFAISAPLVSRQAALLDTKADSIDGHPQLRRRRLIVVALNEQLEQPHLMWREIVIGQLWCLIFSEQLEDAARTATIP